MPQIGEIKSNKDLGYKSDGRFIWQACKRCGRERWVQLFHGKGRWECCRKCGVLATNYLNRGSHHYNWKGGIARASTGYVTQRLHRDSPFAPMLRGRKNNEILQHRLVMAQHLGRCLETNELVHHLNGEKDDNRIENLAIVNLKNHPGDTLNTVLKERIRVLEKPLGYIDK